VFAEPFYMFTHLFDKSVDEPHLTVEVTDDRFLFRDRRQRENHVLNIVQAKTVFGASV